MATIIIAVGAGVATIVTSIVGYFLIENASPSEQEDNKGEITNIIKLQLPENKNEQHYIFVTYAIAGIVALYLVSRIVKKCHHTAKVKREIARLADLENPRIEDI